MRSNNRRKGRMMIREWTMGLIVTVALGLAIVIPQSASAVSLKTSGIVEGDTILLGDIFTGLERDAGKVLGPAPRPGHDMILNARTLMRIATALDLPWRPATGADQIVLRRAATVIDTAMIKDALKNEISARGIPGKFEIVLAEGDTQILLPQDAQQSLEISSLDIRPGKDTFEAVIAAPSRINPLREMKIAGSLQRMLEVPVLLGVLQSGDVIGRNDIGFIEVRADAVSQDMFLNAEDLIGMTPRRILQAGQPIKDSEVQQPRLVERGKSVTMVFSKNGLTLTAQGKALENGAVGDVIRVANAGSSKTVEATVTGAGEVTVQSF